MQKKKLMSIACLAFCLTITLFIGVTSSATYDPWCDVNDDGIIDIVDLVNLGIRFGEEGTPINKTALLLELLERVEELENQSVPLGYVGPSGYDSGWIPIAKDEELVLTHNLNTTDLLVYVLGKNEEGPNQNRFGGDNWSGGYNGLQWNRLTNSTIRLLRLSHDVNYEYVRVRLWKILPAP